MKIRKYTGWLMVCLMLLGMVSCSDDGKDIPASPLVVTESKVDFASAGGDGEITVKSTSPISSVQSSDSWCKAVSDGAYSVKLSIDEQLNPENRMAIVTITDGDGNVKHVSVTQSGLRFNLYEKRVSVSDKGNPTLVRMEATGRTSFQDVPEWLHPIARNDSLVLAADPNNTGNIRSGQMRITCGDKMDSIFVVQGDVSDIVGDYYLVGSRDFNSVTYNYGYGSDPAKLNAQDLTISYAGGDSLTLSFTGKEEWDMKCNVYFDKHTFMFRIKGGTYIGQTTKNNSYPACKLGLWSGSFARLIPQIPILSPYPIAENLMVSTDFYFSLSPEGYVLSQTVSNEPWADKDNSEWHSLVFVCHRNKDTDSGNRIPSFAYPAAVHAFFIKKTPGIPDYPVRNR